MACTIVKAVFEHIWSEQTEMKDDMIQADLPALLLLTRRIAFDQHSSVAEHGNTNTSVTAERGTDLKPAHALHLFLLEGMSADEIAGRYQTGVNHIEALITAAWQEVRNCMD